MFCTGLYSLRFCFYLLCQSSSASALRFSSDNDMNNLVALALLGGIAATRGKALFFILREGLRAPTVGPISKASTITLLLAGAPIVF